MRHSRMIVGLITLVSGVIIWTGSALETVAQTIVIEQATVYYAVGTSGDSNPVEMLDDGAHGDGEAGDGVYGAEIPSNSAGRGIRLQRLQGSVFELPGLNPFGVLHMPVGEIGRSFKYQG